MNDASILSGNILTVALWLWKNKNGKWDNFYTREIVVAQLNKKKKSSKQSVILVVVVI